jgi:acetate kinase
MGFHALKRHQRHACGDIDPAIVTYLLRKEHRDPARLEQTSTPGFIRAIGIRVNLLRPSQEARQSRGALAFAIAYRSTFGSIRQFSKEPKSEYLVPFIPSLQ